MMEQRISTARLETHRSAITARRRPPTMWGSYGWRALLLALSGILPSEPSVASEPERYAVIFRFIVGQDGTTQAFDVDSVIELKDHKRTPVQIVPPAEYLAAARGLFEARHSAPTLEGGALKPMFTYFLFDPNLPDRPDLQIEEPVPDRNYRAPFRFTMTIDKTSQYAQRFGPMPYVLNGVITVFEGESFGVRLDVKDGKVASITYEPDLSKADVVFDCDQDRDEHGQVRTRLQIENRTAHEIRFDAAMMLPQHAGQVGTDILPIPPGKVGKERWPQPIVRLLLSHASID